MYLNSDLVVFALCLGGVTRGNTVRVGVSHMLHHHCLYSSMTAKWELSKYLPLLPPCKNKIPDGPVILSQSLIDRTIRLVCSALTPQPLPENIPCFTSENVKSNQTTSKFSWQLSGLLSCDSNKFQEIFETMFLRKCFGQFQTCNKSKHLNTF